MEQCETVRIGMIGLGPRTETLLASVFALAGNGEVKVTAICDLQDERIAKILGILESHGAEKPAVYKNYRELIASPDVDAVLVPTSWNSHLPIACDAMRMGKYVGIEVGGAAQGAGWTKQGACAIISGVNSVCMQKIPEKFAEKYRI